MTKGAFDRDMPERRHFCRIDDEVILHYRPLQDGGGADRGSVPAASSPPFAVFSHLAEQREHVRLLLRELRSIEPRIVRCLGALEERIGLLETAMLLDRVAAHPELRRSVTLSAGGISFRTGKPYSKDAVLLLEMILLPTLTGIVSQGRVLRSTRQFGRDGEPPYLTTVEFTEMRESTRDIIARHVLARQGHRLRRSRD